MTIGGLVGIVYVILQYHTVAANGGMLHNNQDGALLYYRSQDGGNSWDAGYINGFVELDSSANFPGFDGDSYAIHARGNTISLCSIQ